MELTPLCVYLAIVFGADEIAGLRQRNQEELASLREPKWFGSQTKSKIQSSPKRQRREAEWDDFLQKDILGKYITNYETVEQWLEQLAAGTPHLIQLIRIQNVTFEGRQFTIAKLGQHADNVVKPVIWIDAGIHPREKLTQPTAIYLIYRLLDDYYSGTNKDLLEDIDWYILPNINPDGFAVTNDRSQGAQGALWRKNVAAYPSYNNTGAEDNPGTRTAEPCRGVDLNRNFPEHWGYVPDHRVHHCAGTFAGPYAASENETRTLMRVLEDMGDVLSAYVAMHTFSQIVTGSWAFITDERPRNAAEMDRVGKKIAAAISDAHGRDYRYGLPPDIQYPYSGNAADWVTSALNVTFSYTLELRDKDSFPNGRGHMIPEGDIIDVGEETHAGMVVLAREVLAKWNGETADAAQRADARSLNNFLAFVFVCFMQRALCK
ncbi:hypothetical protein CAPTEDRAFT_163199 [Capitella teleta]|uniref:Peptidase M14 domain-containing protein n=1 Tax=Capitella teleta TaxID=283909 RepID=R7VM83_CAPTE|nr:hypothetical protein CAPTEDRAFT_163199 [Capitella teleta]|eukprot:ELU18390.1 hypothetical protein CAPTEDRAFT_163199 [Capitella teleta]